MTRLRRATTSLILAASLVLPPTALLAAQEPPPPPPPPPPMTPVPPPVALSGDALVQKYNNAFQKMGEPTFEKMDVMLAELADAARLAHEAGTIDDEFSRRYGRVLMVAKLMTVTDRGRLLSPIFDREFSAFVKDVTGRTYDSSPNATGQIGMLSDAMATELSSLGLKAPRKSR